VYRFLLTSRWLAGLAVAMVVATVCVLLGTWQWHRREQRLEANAAVTGNYDRTPVPLAEVLASPQAGFPAEAAWTPVAVRGEYLAQEALLLRNRPLDGRPGYHVLVPLRTTTGTVLLVDRGWLPTGATGSRPDAVPAPPRGTVDVVARLRPPEPAFGADAPGGQVRSLDLGHIAGTLPSGGDLLTGAYGVLDHEQPPPEQSPVALPRPVVDEGPHLSYSLQWFVFAIGAFVGYGVLARRTAQDLRQVPERPASRPRRRTAEEEEDELLDAAERAQAARRSTRAGST
jgi:cytochrome oxidase assembly protein ShyY1